MKNVTAALVLSLFIGSTVHAQDDRSVRLGIKLAPNMGFLSPDTKGLSSDGSRLGFTFGLMSDFMLGTNKNYAFSTGLYLNNVGGKLKQNVAYIVDGQAREGALSSELKLQYIEVPLTIKLLTNEIGYMRYFGQLGFGPAFNIAAKATTTVPQGSGIEAMDDEDFQDNIALFRASLVVGAGLEYNFSGNTSLMAGVNYSNGFTNTLNDLEVDGKNAQAKQHYVELNVGVFF
ncbi:MAG TPA: porin family protein [Flavobacteriales bacterium]